MDARVATDPRNAFFSRDPDKLGRGAYFFLREHISSWLQSHGKFGQLNSIRILVLAMYSCTMAFIFSAGILINAWDFNTEGHCRAAIDVYLVLYVGGKPFLHLFLVVRAHQL